MLSLWLTNSVCQGPVVLWFPEQLGQAGVQGRRVEMGSWCREVCGSELCLALEKGWSSRGHCWVENISMWKISSDSGSTLKLSSFYIGFSCTRVPHAWFCFFLLWNTDLNHEAGLGWMLTIPRLRFLADFGVSTSRTVTWFSCFPCSALFQMSPPREQVRTRQRKWQGFFSVKPFSNLRL